MPAVKTMAQRRKAKEAQARYDAGGYGRRVKGWNPPASGPQRALEGFERIRSRAQDAVRNDWAAGSGTQKWATSLVGVGIQPRWENPAHRRIWDRWGKQADADCVLDVYGMQALTATTWLGGGEAFLRRRPRPLGQDLYLPLQVQLVESNFVPMMDADSWPGLPVGNTIRQGVERDKRGTRTALWMYKEHPGDPTSRPEINPTDLVRVPARDVRHVYEPKRPGQLRGVSELANVLMKLRGSANFEDAVLERQQLANLFVAFLKRTMPPDWADVAIDAATGLPKWYDSEGRALAGMQPGVMQELMPGEDISFANPPEAGTSYSDFMRTSHLGTSAGIGMPYELMSGDIREVSDRTLRIVVNEFRRFCEQRQWHVLIPMACQPIVEWVGQAAVLAGELPITELEAFNAPEWSPHGWEYIHPVQDVEAAIKARDAGFTSTSRVIAKRGDDPRVIKEERDADEASGLTPKPPVAPAAKPPDPAQRAQARMFEAQAALADAQRLAAAVPLQTPDTSPLEHFLASLAGNNASINGIAASVAALAARPQENHIHVPEGPAPVVNVAAAAAPDVHITNDVHVPEQAAPVVNVTNEIPEQAAPIVNITNDVQPADVTVDVNLPERKTTSDITRDANGEIVGVVQTERTVQ